jgi:predicted nucleotidyltransferase
MKLDEIHIDDILQLCKKHNVRSLSVFGSVVHGDAKEASDIDLLVSFSHPISLLQLVALERELSMILGRKVDLNTKASLSPYLRTQILKECQLLYAA